MVLSSSQTQDAFKRVLNGIAVEVQGTDFGEVAHEDVVVACVYCGPPSVAVVDIDTPSESLVSISTALSASHQCQSSIRNFSLIPTLMPSKYPSSVLPANYA
ncbi:hypothetical protein GALMADRAFT_134655 [Galerina marginata CBS 339.88]|uniref:Uncharacterized protein n=1 Tax=Galerina marginata (strain CBS 339.88) TaxID=685588 RepID=A0A067TLD7_GALM3|nr:hypothetical protein GALMADRAFT_134655 [Galerina marginata CBS 339.88]